MGDIYVKAIRGATNLTMNFVYNQTFCRFYFFKLHWKSEIIIIIFIFLLFLLTFYCFSKPSNPSIGAAAQPHFTLPFKTICLLVIFTQLKKQLDFIEYLRILNSQALT